MAIGLSPNAVSYIGALGSIIAALIFFPTGHLFAGTLVVALFVLSDLFDGTMARIQNSGGTTWGSFVDSTLDRFTDIAILAGIALYFRVDQPWLFVAALIALVTGFLVSYIRAKAEALDLECDVGIAERTERLIIILVASGLHGLGLPYIMAIALWLLIILGVVTIAQRIALVRRATR